MNEELKQEIIDLTQHYIPFYAYGDNQAACEMAQRLEKIAVLVSQIEPPVIPEIADGEIILKDTPELKVVDKPNWWLEINGVRYTYPLLQAWGEGGISVGGKFEVTKRESHYFELHRLD